ncbi:MAG: MBL fold metallo-hydrolase [Betaproteobacteria bacterium]|nr:MAG: MBL fold metallo-hydrolase [Betaproteobacteria bacterium]
MRFASLASGSGGNCLVAQADLTRVLIDCGLSLTDTERRLARLGLEPADIDAILVTHEHDDHAGCVFDFAAAHNVLVVLTHGTLRALRAAGKMHDGVRTLFLRSGERAPIGGMEVLPFTVPHDAAEPVQFVLSDGAAKLGVVTDIGIGTRHVEQMLSGLDALVLECNYDRDMLWSGAYPRWLKERIGGPFGHLDNHDAARLLGALDRSRLKHIIGAHLSQQNNTPALARAALAAALGCEPGWVGLATQEDGFDWREA